MSVKDDIDLKRLPSHIAIIMDGNGRWAKERNQNRLFGHQKGVESVRAVTEASAELGVENLTLYAFSTENWGRPKKEVDGLMELLVATIRKEVATLQKNNIRLHVIGDQSSLPVKCRMELEEAMKITRENRKMNLLMALSYSSRWEIAQAVKKIGRDIRSGKVEPEEINSDLVSQYLTTAPFPDPELMIRTGGDFRISNFLLYQLAYAELYFTSKKWPDFGKEDLYEAIIDFQSRERRFGKTSEQIS